MNAAKVVVHEIERQRVNVIVQLLSGADILRLPGSLVIATKTGTVADWRVSGGERQKAALHLTLSNCSS